MQSILFGVGLIVSLYVGLSYTAPIYQQAIESDLEQKVVAVAHKHLKDKTQVELLSIRCSSNSLSLESAAISPTQLEKITLELDGILGLYLPDSLPSSPAPSTHTASINKSISSINQGDIPKPTHFEKTVALPHFTVTENDQQNTLTIEGALASTNEKQEILNHFKKIQDEPLASRHMIDKLEIRSDVTTLKEVKQLCQQAYLFVLSADNARFSWNTKQMSLSGQIQTESEILEVIKKFEDLFSDDAPVLRSELVLSKEPTLEFTVERLSNNKIIVSGILPTKEMGKTLLQIVSKAHHENLQPQQKAFIVNNLRYSDIQKEAWWLGEPNHFLSNFLTQTEGIAKIEYSQDGLYIEGIYKNQEEFIEARTKFRKIPKEIKIYDDFLRHKE